MYGEEFKNKIYTVNRVKIIKLIKILSRYLSQNINKNLEEKNGEPV